MDFESQTVEVIGESMRIEFFYNIRIVWKIANCACLEIASQITLRIICYFHRNLPDILHQIISF